MSISNYTVCPLHYLECNGIGALEEGHVQRQKAINKRCPLRLRQRLVVIDCACCLVVCRECYAGRIAAREQPHAYAIVEVLAVHTIAQGCGRAVLTRGGYASESTACVRDRGRWNWRG